MITIAIGRRRNGNEDNDKNINVTRGGVGLSNRE